MEDITCENFPIEFGNKLLGAKALLYNADLRVLLVGDANGKVIQYSQDNNWLLQKDYGHLGVGMILACAQFGDFGVFGGSAGNYCNLRVINVKTQKLLLQKVETAFQQISSLEFGSSSWSTFLLVSGGSPNFSHRTDLFLVSKQNTQQSPLQKKQQSNLSQSPSLVSDLTQTLAHQTQLIFQLQRENQMLKSQVQKLLSSTELKTDSRNCKSFAHLQNPHNLDNFQNLNKHHSHKNKIDLKENNSLTHQILKLNPLPKLSSNHSQFENLGESSKFLGSDTVTCSSW